MPPRGKKARGRQNRAKKEATRAAREADLRSLWEPTILCLGVNNGANNVSSCEHMLAVPPQIPRQGPAVSLMNLIASEGLFDSATSFTGVDDPVDLCMRSLSRFPKVLAKESERSLAMDLLLRFVRNIFLHDSAIDGQSWFQQHHHNEVAICCVINMLELLGTYSDWNVVKCRAIKMNNRLAAGNRRDTVKFVAKRLPCSCLKELHIAVRSRVAKVGTCYGCGNRFSRSDLYVCTGCNMAVYCSPVCHRADWSRHKEYCGNPELASPP